MQSTLLVQAARLTIFPVLATIVGTLVAVWRPPGTRTVAAIQHFAAGVVIAALAGEVLPDLKEREDHKLVWTAVGFALGVAVMLVLGAWERRRSAAEKARAVSATGAAGTAEGPRSLPMGMLIAIGIDLVIDGMLVGLGVTLGSATGLIITIALTIEVLFLGVSAALELLGEGFGRRTVIWVGVVLALLVGVGALGGVLLLGGAPATVQVAFLAFGAAALLFLAIEELIVEAHEVEEKAWMSAMLFAGFFIIWLLEALVD